MNTYKGDLVAVHTHQSWPGNEEYVTMDFFRFDTSNKPGTLYPCYSEKRGMNSGNKNGKKDPGFFRRQVQKRVTD